MTNSPTIFSTILIVSLVLNAQQLLADESNKTSHFIVARHRKSRPHKPSPPAKPELLIFADERLKAVYPIVQKFKSTISSDPLNITKSWTGSNICNYTGFYCEDPPDNSSAIAVASIDFNGFRLSAPTLDGFLENLPDLALFHANSNDFGGTISAEIAKLKYLYELDISNNRFSGTFPSAVLGMEGLTFLDIRFNLFSGSVPPEIFTQNLEALFINNNAFVRISLPDLTLQASHIVYLTLANNKFVGPIPLAVLKLLSSVSEVLLSNNELAGCVPYEIGFLKEARVIELGNNRLTGPLPMSLACLESVEQLDFGGNLLYGLVPEVVCEVLGNLSRFSLSDNFFMYVGPACRRLIERGVLDVEKNCVPDLPNQRSVKECVEFFSIPRRFCPYMWSYSHIPCEPPRLRSHASLLSPP